MKKTLFDISDDMLAIREMMEGFDGDVSDEDVEKLIDKLFDADKENQEAFDKKVDSYIWLIKELKADAKTAKEEGDRLTALAKRFNAHATKLSERLEAVFRRLGLTERKTKYHHPKFGLSGGVRKLSVDLTGWSLDPDLDGEGTPVPDCYIVNKPELNVDMVREELENGGTLAFAKLEDRKEKLKIK